MNLSLVSTALLVTLLIGIFCSYNFSASAQLSNRAPWNSSAPIPSIYRFNGIFSEKNEFNETFDQAAKRMLEEMEGNEMTKFTEEIQKHNDYATLKPRDKIDIMRENYEILQKLEQEQLEQERLEQCSNITFRSSLETECS